MAAAPPIGTTAPGCTWPPPTGMGGSSRPAPLFRAAVTSTSSLRRGCHLDSMAANWRQGGSGVPLSLKARAISAHRISTTCVGEPIK